MSDRQPHDEQFKDFFGHRAMVLSFLRAFVRLPFVSALKEDSLRPLPTESVGADHHRLYGDQVWQGELSGRPRRCYVVILMEFQSSPDYAMPFRMLTYVVAILRFWRREREEAHRRRNEKRRLEGKAPLPMPREDFPLLFPLVIYIGQGRWLLPREMRRLFGPVSRRHLRYLPGLEFFLFDARRAVLNHPELRESLAAQWFRFKLAKSPEEQADALSALALILESARYGELEELRRTFASWFAPSFRKYRIKGNWRELLRNNQFVEVSKVYVDGLREWRKKYGKRCLVKGRAEGHAEGHAEGRAEGLTEGELKNQKANLGGYLETRFGAVPQAVRTYLARATDYEALCRLTRGAWQAGSLDDFLALLDRERQAGAPANKQR